MSYTDVLAREVAWLQTSGDGLPNLADSWPVIQAYWPKSFAKTRKPTLFVLRDKAAFTRFGNQRTDQTHSIAIHCRWPLTTATGLSAGETDQANFDAALNALTTRVLGPLQDKTHGGRFLAAADNESGHAPLLDVVYTDPARGLAEGALEAVVRYEVNDFQLNN